MQTMPVDHNGLRQAVDRLLRRLQLPGGITDLQITFTADSQPTMTITRLLTPAEIDELSTWYVVELIDRIPEAKTTFNLELRPTQLESELPVQCDPIEQQARQDKLDERYAADGRHDPAHPRHATYTGLGLQQEVQQ